MSRMLKKAREFRPNTYLRKFVAPDFQKCIRAEAAARVEKVRVPYSACGFELSDVFSPLGQMICVTCGRRGDYRHTQGMQFHAGHFLGSRRNSILLREENCHPQCAACNIDGGSPQRYRAFMESEHGEDVILWLQDLKDNYVQTWTIEELVELRQRYRARIKEAESVL